MKKLIYVALAAFVLTLVPFAQAASASGSTGSQSLEAGSKSTGTRHHKKYKKSQKTKHARKGKAAKKRNLG
jgi:hypothetical protein